MQTYLYLSSAQSETLPPELRDDDVRYPLGLVEHFLLEYTHSGDTVFDPFAGYSTTLTTAEAMGRLALADRPYHNKY